MRSNFTTRRPYGGSSRARSPAERQSCCWPRRVMVSTRGVRGPALPRYANWPVVVGSAAENANVGPAVGHGEAGGLGREGDGPDQLIAAVGDLTHPDEDRGARVEGAHRAVALAWLRTTLPFCVQASTMASSSLQILLMIVSS